MSKKKQQMTKAERIENVRKAMEEMRKMMASLPGDLEKSVREDRFGGPAVAAVFNFLAPDMQRVIKVPKPELSKCSSDEEFKEAMAGYNEYCKMVRAVSAWWFTAGIHYDAAYYKFIESLDEAKQAEQSPQ